MVSEEGEAAVAAECGDRHASAMLLAPPSRCKLTALLRTVARTCGPAPVRTVQRSSSKVTSRTQCTRFSMPTLAQPCRDHRGPGLFERQAADRVDHLDGARAGGTDEAFAGDPDNLLGVRESDSSAAVRICSVRRSMRPWP